MIDSLDQMRTFVRAAEAGSFAEAGRRLSISRAAVSKSIGRLEDHLGVTLFHRTTRGLALTDEGRTFREGCAAVLDMVIDLEAEVRDRHGALPGRLRLFGPRRFGANYIVPLVARYARAHPDVQIELRLSDRPIDLIDEGIDLAVRVTAPADSTFVGRRLARVPVVLCATPDYLARHGTPRHPDDLTGHRCVIDANFRVRHRWPFRVDGQRYVVSVPPTVAVDSPVAVRDLVMGGVGIGACPITVVDADLAAGRLIHLLPETPTDHDLGIWALTPPGRRSRKVEAFLALLEERFSDRW